MVMFSIVIILNWYFLEIGKEMTKNIEFKTTQEWLFDQHLFRY